MSENWRIERLCELAEAALSQSSYGGAGSARVRDLPDVRTIRYYTSLGLIDRPAEMRGRTAYYNEHHLMQLVAIKRLQARGFSLSDIQQRIIGVSPTQLKKLAELPAGFLERIADQAQPSAKHEPAAGEQPHVAPSGAENKDRLSHARRAFWAESPEVSEKHASEFSAAAQPSQRTPTPALIIPLAEGAALLLEGVPAERLGPAAMQSLGPAVAKLKQALRQIDALSASATSEAGEGAASDNDTGQHPPQGNADRSP